MSLLSLPNELILIIVEYIELPRAYTSSLHDQECWHLEVQRDLHSFILVNRRLSGFLPRLYKYSIKNCGDRGIVHAAALGSLPAVQRFVAEGFDARFSARADGTIPVKRGPWEQREDGHHILLASKYGHAEIVKYLIGKGADPFFINHYGETPLLLAIRNGSLEIVELLFEQPNPRVRDEHSLGLFDAAAKGNIPMASLLLAHGARVDFVCGGYSYLASHQNYPTELILHGTVLFTAIWCGHLDMVQLLINHGADVDWLPFDPSGRGTALSVAVTRGHEDIVKLLLEYTTVNVWDGTLHRAVFDSSPSIAKLLLDELDQSPLPQHLPSAHNLLAMAVERGDMKAFELCLDHGFDENEALAMAIRYENAAMTRILLVRGKCPPPPPHIPDAAVDAAFFRSDISAIKMLLARGRRIHPATVIYCRQNRSMEVAALAERFPRLFQW